MDRNIVVQHHLQALPKRPFRFISFVDEVRRRFRLTSLADVGEAHLYSYGFQGQCAGMVQFNVLGDRCRSDPLFLDLL